MMPSPVLDAYKVEAKNDAFRATLLWEKIVMHLERSVKCGRRIQGWRTFDNCFPGYKAVECLVAYLNTILPKHIKRSQVQTLCQKLLLTDVIEDVKNREKCMFQESRLYRFTHKHFWGVPAWQDETSSGIPRSKSVDSHTLKATGHTEKNSKTLPEMKGYASDSTIAPLSVVRKKKQRTVIKSALDPKLSDRTVLSQHCKEKVGNMIKPQTLGPKPHKPFTNGQERSLFCKKPDSHTAKVSQKNMDVCKEARRLAMPAEEVKTHRASVHLKNNRHSLNFKRTQERDLVLLSSHHDVLQKMVFVNKATLHRSHSFSSSSAGSGSAPAEGKNKWVVYGYI